MVCKNGSSSAELQKVAAIVSQMVKEICILQMVTAPRYWGRRSFPFRDGLAFWRGSQRPCLRFIGDTTSHCIPRQGSQHQDQEHVTLHNDSGRGPVVRRVRRQAQEILRQIKAETLRHAGRREGSTWPVNLQPLSLVWARAADASEPFRIFPCSHRGALRALTSENVGQAQDKCGRYGRPARSGCSAVIQHGNLEAHLRRATVGSVKITIRRVVGKRNSSLYAHSISTVNRTHIHPSFLKTPLHVILQNAAKPRKDVTRVLLKNQRQTPLSHSTTASLVHRA
jgi:hypothetical protein